MKKFCLVSALIILLAAAPLTAFGVDTVVYSMGDINGDGKINALDASVILQHDAKLITLFDEQLNYADVDGDGKVNALDASVILQYDARLIDRFPADPPSDSESTLTADSSSTSNETSLMDNPQKLVTPDDAEWISNRIIQLLNAERAAIGAGPLSTAPKAHVMAMVRAQQLTVYWGHKLPDGRDSCFIYTDYKYNPDSNEFLDVEMTQCAYIPFASSENIAQTVAWKEDTREAIANKIVQQFKGSPGHWNDLMNTRYSGVGVGLFFVDDAPDPNDPEAYLWPYGLYTAIMTMDKTYG